MNQFYVYMIFAGIMMVLISLALVAYDRKKSMDYNSLLEERKEQLTEILADADQMIDEMNKFSDYLVTQIDEKNDQITSTLQSVEEKIQEVSAGRLEREEEERIPQSQVVNGNPVEIRMSGDAYSQVRQTESMPETLPPVITFTQAGISAYKSSGRNRDKVVPFNSKANSVLQLSRNGLSDTEIAKTLKMGKGEVQLILEMNK